MIRSAIINFTLFSLFAFNFVSCSNEQLNTEFVENLSEYLRSNPNVTILQEIDRNLLAAGTIRYTQGARVKGDRIVANISGSTPFNPSTNVSVTLTYPKSGTGEVVSYVEINVNQTSTIGKAYIVAGGIKQRQISIVIEANITDSLRFHAQIYSSATKQSTIKILLFMQTLIVLVLVSKYELVKF